MLGYWWVLDVGVGVLRWRVLVMCDDMQDCGRRFLLLFSDGVRVGRGGHCDYVILFTLRRHVLGR
jgi:hypothetical protein